LCTNGARLAISYPPKFKPDETNWFLWRPQVERFFFRIKLDPRILLARHDTAFTTEQHATALSIITEISPDSESEWFARLNFTRAYQEWEELERAYAPRAELELQAKLEDLETARQTETESIREWTLRLRRLILEVQAMNDEHAVTDAVHKLKLLRIKPILGSEDGFNNFVATIRHSLHLKSVHRSLSPAASRLILRTHLPFIIGMPSGRSTTSNTSWATSDYIPSFNAMSQSFASELASAEAREGESECSVFSLE
jgi:hypothetical protein